MDNKTEPATPRRRSEARKKGKVARSAEIEHAAVLLGAMLILWAAGPSLTEAMLAVCRSSFGALVHPEFNIPSATQLIAGTIISVLVPLAPVMIGMAAVSAFAGYGQVGLQVTGEALEINLDRLDPVNGMMRFFSLRSVAQMMVSSLKVIAILAVGYLTIRAHLPSILGLHHATPPTVFKTLCMATLDLGLRVGILLALIAAADYGYQRWQYERDLRMSKDEVKEEQKLLEGNPEVEARIRRMQITLSRSRMLRNVKKADVVVRNPTHYAVALKYDPAKASAPIVLAKGADYLALRIIELAREHRVHTVRDAPLAQALYKTVEVGEVIPAKLYRAVARLLLYVYKLRGQNPPGAR
jgi:flagellar biosynthetic protein FlhB